MRFNRYIFRHLIFLFTNNIARSIFPRIRFRYSLLFRRHGSKDYIVFTAVLVVIIPDHYIGRMPDILFPVPIIDIRSTFLPVFPYPLIVLLMLGVFAVPVRIFPEPIIWEWTA